MAFEHRPRERLAFNAGPATVIQYPARRDQGAQATASAPAPVPAVVRRSEKSDWAYRGLLAFTAVLMLRPQDQIPGLGALHLAELSALAGLASMVMQRLGRGLPVMRSTPESLGLLAFGGAILFSLPFSIWPGGVLSMFLDTFAKMLVVFILMVNTLSTPRRLEQITWLIVVSCGYICVLSLYYYARGINLVEGDRLGGPLGGIFGNPNDLAMNMVTFLPVAIVLALAPAASGGRRATAAVIVLLMMATIVLTKSRGAMLGLACMLLPLIFMGHRVRKGFAATAIVGILLALPFVPASVWSRMATIFDSERDRTEFSGSREARSTVMREGIQVFLERPLWGVGAGQFSNYNPPGRKERWRETHNALIQVAAETGLPGLLAFVFLIVRASMAAAATRKMIDIPRRTSRPDLAASALAPDERRGLMLHSVAVSAGVVGWFVCAQFASVAYSWTFYYLLALIVAGRDLTHARLMAVRQRIQPA
jgi:putative inorganic carbon (hco3(-)) transporter